MNEADPVGFRASNRGVSVLGKTALIVDDSKTARVVLKRMLETHSLEVDTAESAENSRSSVSSSGIRPYGKS